MKKIAKNSRYLKTNQYIIIYISMSNINYSNGKIYKILNYIDDQCYVGSTTQALSKRMVWHRDAMLKLES